MHISEKEFLDQWNNREQFFKRYKELSNRFDWLTSLFDKLTDLTINIDENTRIVRINGEPLKENPSLDYFACANDGVTTDSRQGSLQNHIDKFKDNTEITEYIHDIYKIMGGFDQNSQSVMKPYFRIISCTVTNANDNGSLNSNGISQKVSSQFATNTYFFRVIQTIKDIENNKFDPDNSHIVLRWEDTNNQHEKELAQRGILKQRFPYKFLYMWANRKELIHLVGLEQYQNICHNTDGDKGHLYFNDQNIDKDYKIFIEEWKTYSSNILNLIKVSNNELTEEEIIKDASKLLSIMFSKNVSVLDLQEFLKSKKSLVLWGPPGTGKTYMAKELARKIIELNKEQPLDNCEQFKLVQFHPNYTYEDFIGGIFPKCEGNGIAYELREGSFKSFCDKAAQDLKHEYVFIIDEINRADLSSVFGELLYALEYRGGNINIPNFGEFSIPENVYIIGTMNNVDKSLTGFDFAMRRRFGFYKIMPDLDIIKDIITAQYPDVDKMHISNEQIDLYTKQCYRLNHKIKNDLQLGEDYQIGQAYFGEIVKFIGDNSDITTLHLKKMWVYYIKPLLEEYLANRLEDDSVRKKLNEVGESFCNDLKS